MKLTKRNYFSPKANREFMSVSQFKSFKKCPACALAEINGEYEREKTTALIVGSFVDAYFEGARSFKAFLRNNPDILKKDGALKADYVQAYKIIERIKRDKLFMEYMTGKKQVVMTGNICGVPVKIKIDVLHDNKIVDGKIMATFNAGRDPERGFLPWFEFWGYDLQGAVYQEVVRQNIGKRLPFYLAAATKEKTTDIDILHINQDILDVAYASFTADVETFDAIKKGIIPAERCEWCEYCKTTKVLTAPTEANEYYLF